MENPIQSSFIPQDAAEAAGAARTYRTGGLSDLILLVAIVMFVASAALGAAVFLYEEYMKASANSKIQQLERAREAFEPATIQEITRMDDRMRVAEQVLQSHLAVTAFFNTLQFSTLSTVSFGTLEFDAVDRQRIGIKMSGVAQSVNSIALQADIFSRHGVITSPVFSDITRRPDGVHFNLTALINPSSIRYVNLIAGLVERAQQEGQQSQQMQQQLVPQQQVPPQEEQEPASPFSPQAQ